VHGDPRPDLLEWACRLTEPDHQRPRRKPYRTYRETWLAVTALLGPRPRSGSNADALEPTSGAPPAAPVITLYLLAVLGLFTAALSDCT
jgi:hypothetical protein